MIRKADIRCPWNSELESLTKTINKVKVGMLCKYYINFFLICTTSSFFMSDRAHMHRPSIVAMPVITHWFSAQHSHVSLALSTSCNTIPFFGIKIHMYSFNLTHQQMKITTCPIKFGFLRLMWQRDVPISRSKFSVSHTSVSRSEVETVMRR